MPLYLDVHNKIDGLTADGAAEGPRKDLEVQKKHGVNYFLSMWSSPVPAWATTRLNA